MAIKCMCETNKLVSVCASIYVCTKMFPLTKHKQNETYTSHLIHVILLAYHGQLTYAFTYILYIISFTNQ